MLHCCQGLIAESRQALQLAKELLGVAAHLSTTHDQNRPVGHGGKGGIPAAGRHVGTQRIARTKGIEDTQGKEPVCQKAVIQVHIIATGYETVAVG